jgi:secreted PhoX family phosphatase
MPSYLDPLTFPVLDVPAIWCPEKERVLGNSLAVSIEAQAKASLLASADTVESILRLLFDEAEIDRVFEPPQGYNPEVQGDWDDQQVTFVFRRRVEKISEERDNESLRMEYRMEGCGQYRVEITSESFSIEKEP